MTGAVNPLAISASPSLDPAPKPVRSSPIEPSPVHQFEVDGVQCFWTPGHGEMTAGLVVGVGEGDERFHERGLTSLIADLALRGVAAESGTQWFVDIHHTTMKMTGPSVYVQPFLRSLVRSLNNLQTHDITSVAASLVEQSLRSTEPASREALSILYGFDGPGRSTLPSMGILEPDLTAIATWLQKYFVKENVAAFFYGPRPEGASFANLASGQRPARPLIDEGVDRTPTLHRSLCEGPSLFTPIASDRTSAFVVEVAARRVVERLDQLFGGSCSVRTSLTDLDANTAWLALSTKAEPEHHQQVFETMRSELYRLAAEGPGRPEVDRYMEITGELYASLDSHCAIGEACGQAKAFLDGTDYESHADFRASLATSTSTALGLPLLRALPSAVWVLPKGSPAADSNMNRQSTLWRNFPGRTDSDPTPDGLECLDDKLLFHFANVERPIAVSAKDVVGAVSMPDGSLKLHTREGLIVPMDLEEPATTEAIVSFLAKLPPERLVRADQPMDFEIHEPVTPDPVVAEEVELVTVADDAVSSPEPPEVEADDAPIELISDDAEVVDIVEQAAPEDPEPPSEDADHESKRTFLSKKRRKAESSRSPVRTKASGQAAVPNDSITYCYPSAIQFAEAIVQGAWPMVERLYEAASDSPDDQAHLVHVASSTGGDPTRLDSWIEGSALPGVGMMIRGALRQREAWKAHCETGTNKSRKERDRLASEFASAEEDLLLATVELPESPVPWVPLLEVTRILGLPRSVADERYVAHVERGALLAGHLEFQRFISKRWGGSHQDMWEHVDFVCRAAVDGSAEFAVAPMAFIEQWLDEVESGNPAMNGSWFLRQEGFDAILDDAARRSVESESFDLLSTAAARALEVFFTFYWSVGDYAMAAELAPFMGRRFSGDPMCYFSKDSWPTIRATAEAFSQNAA